MKIKYLAYDEKSNDNFLSSNTSTILKLNMSNATLELYNLNKVLTKFTVISSLYDHFSIILFKKHGWICTHNKEFGRGNLKFTNFIENFVGNDPLQIKICCNLNTVCFCFIF